MINILIADDHPFVREGLKKTLREKSDIKICGEAKDGEDLLKLLEEQNADAVVLDVSMPGRNGLDVLTEIKSRWPKTAVVILSMYPEEHFAVRAIKNGASGYVTKDSAPYDLVKAIRKGVAGGKYITQSVGEQLAIEVGHRYKNAPHGKLSDRELEVLCMIASGKSTREIAEELFVSINTVYTHRERILEKLNIKSNTEITQYALRNKLVE